MKENGREKKAIKIESCHQRYFTILSSKTSIHEYQKTEVVVLMGLYNIEGKIAIVVQRRGSKYNVERGP